MKGLIVKIFVVLCFISPVIYSQSPLIYPGACQSGHQIVIAAVGDVLLHKPLQMKASQQGFQSLWEDAIPYLQAADITYGNIEGPMAFGVNRAGEPVNDPGHRWDDNVYSSFPLFNYHPSLAKELKQSGFDIVSTANNHTLDRLSLGVDRTIHTLDQAKLFFAGTRVKNSPSPWYTIINKKGFRIAWIACTTTTNGIIDRHQQVLYCYKKRDRRKIKNLIYQLKSKVDAIILVPHWGTQYQHRPNQYQIRFAKEMLNAGALAIIGSHPHVIQPMKKYITKDGRITFIAYSLGNFVSYQGTPKNRATIILFLTLIKTSHGTVIKNVRYMPAYMQNRSGERQMRLRFLLVGDHNSIPYKIISKVLPRENLWYAGEPIKKINQCEDVKTLSDGI